MIYRIAKVLLLILPGILFCIPSFSKKPDVDCLNWFRSAKLQSGSKDCKLKCAALVTDMGTFMCPDQCDLLCKSDDQTTVLGKLIYYPGLTPAEKKLVEKNPKDALVVFIQKTRAEWSSSRNFPDQGLNDESDAFRHFIWAGLLTKELGAEKAKEFLEAHEADPDQPQKERQMDLYNNGRGQAAAEKLIKEKIWDLKNLESKGLEVLRSKQLRVLKPGLQIPEVPK